jgi:hypothetical protein
MSHSEGGANVLLDFTASFKAEGGKAGGDKPWQRARSDSRSDSRGAGAADKENAGAAGNTAPAASRPSDEPWAAPEAACVVARDAGSVVGRSGGSSGVGSPVSVASLNARLEQLGFGVLHAGDAGSTVEVVQSLLSELRVQGDAVKRYEAQVHRTALDCKRLQEDKERLALQAQCLRQDVAALDTRVQVMTAKDKADTRRHEAWVKELQVAIAKLEGQQKGWQAALNRKEQEHERLQSRMQMLQSQKDRSVKRALEFAYPPAGAASAEEADAAAALEDLALRGAIRRAAFLLQENSTLRESLASMHAALLESAACRQEQQQQQQPQDATASDALHLSDAVLALPAEALALRVNDLRRLVQQQRHAAESVERGAAGEQSVEELLRDQLEQSKLIIAEQDRLLRTCLFGQRGAGAGAGADDVEDVDAQVQRLRAERIEHEETSELVALRQRVEQERAMILEEAKLLDHERARLEEERLALCGGTPSAAEAKPKQGRPSLLKLVTTPFTLRRLRVQHRPHTPLTPDSRIASLPVQPSPATMALLRDALR